jgi:hypothetical protein
MRRNGRRHISLPTAFPAKIGAIIPAAVLLVLLILLGCSVVFTASITGSAIDREAWENEEVSEGIGDVIVYLYTDELEWTVDYSRYTEADLLPDELDPGEDPRYFASTVSEADGSFTFNGLIWNQLFPQYGKSGDRRKVFFLFYNRDYGLTRNEVPAYVVSDVTNRLPPFKLLRITNSARIEGQVINKNTGVGVGAVNLEFFVATSLSPAVYPAEPDYVAVTAADGSYGVNISFLRDLGDSTSVKITADRNNFNCEDYDDDGTMADGSPGNDYLEAAPVEKDTTYTAEDIEIKQTEFSENLEGLVLSNLADPSSGVNGVTVWLFHSDPTGLITGDMPRDSTYTFSRVVNDATTEDGYFLFTGVEWTDETYTGDYSTFQIWLYRPSSGEIASGSLAGPAAAAKTDAYTMRSTGENWVVIEND